MAAINNESCYLALISMAEEFRSQSPPDIRSCVQCLFAILNLGSHPAIEAKTHLQLGNILMQLTNNFDRSQSHLEKAVINPLFYFHFTHFSIIYQHFCHFSGIYPNLYRIVTKSS